MAVRKRTTVLGIVHRHVSQTLAITGHRPAEVHGRERPMMWQAQACVRAFTDDGDRAEGLSTLPAPPQCRGLNPRSLPRAAHPPRTGTRWRSVTAAVSTSATARFSA